MSVLKVNNRQELEMLNIVKLVASYMVVFIHVSFPGQFGIDIVYLARFAVPFFFIVSGYFSYNSFNLKSIKKIDKKIQTTGLLYLESIGFYLVMILCVQRDFGKFNSWLRAGLSGTNFFEWILWNKIPLIELEHLWFIGALLYCYIFMRIIYKYPNLIKLLPFLLIVNYILGEGGQLFNCTEIPEYITRNAWFCGIPCFAIGYLIRKHESTYVICFWNKLSTKTLFIVAMLTEVLVLVEAHTVGMTDLYVFSLVTAVLLFLYGITHKNNLAQRWKKISEIDTGIIYIIHQVVAIFLRIAIEKIHFKYGNMILPILTCLIATMISIGFKHVKKGVRKQIWKSI